MSRIGRRLIQIPDNVEATIIANNILVKGPLGELTFDFHPAITVKKNENKITVARPNDLRQFKMLHGTTNSIITNMIFGVTQGYKKELEINGVGYNVVRDADKLIFSLGYTHKIYLSIPENLKIEIPKPTILIISGIDKQFVGQYAAKIKSFKKPEPYGGKGIKYKDETIIRKSGKASSK